MRAAAQVAAEMAALQAAEMEQQDQRRYGGNTMTSEDIRFMQAVRASEQVDNSSQHYGNSYAVDNVDPNQLLQAIMAQQQQEMRGHQRQQQSVFPPLIQQRPQEHYITIANNGIILEATKTATGIPPDALLMTSSYDTLHDEDLPGLLCVKTQFWDKGNPNVQAYVRRQNVEGEWIWLEATAITYVSQPIAGIVIREVVVSDVQKARSTSRLTRIAAILIQAVEAACLTQARKELRHTGDDMDEKDGNDSRDMSESYHEEAYTALMETINATGVHMPEQGDAVRKLMRIAQEGSKDSLGNLENKLEQEIIENVTNSKKKFDPFAVMEAVRQGIRLDLGLTMLTLAEVKLITLVLTGKMAAQEVAPLVMHALRSGIGLAKALSHYKLEHERMPAVAAARGPPPILYVPPPLSVLNLSYSYIGSSGVELLSEILYREGSYLKALDVSFCSIEERGISALARAFELRKRHGLSPLKGVILSGNYISGRAASELGVAMSPIKPEAGGRRRKHRRKVRSTGKSRTGYDSDTTETSSDDADDFGSSPTREMKTGPADVDSCPLCDKEQGLQVLHLANTSLTPTALGELLDGLGAHSSVHELNLASNDLGTRGAASLVRFLEGPARSRDHVPMPFLERLDISNNGLGNDGTTQLTRAVSKRSGAHLIDLRLSSNNIGHGGIETMMNKLLQHNLISLSLDKNAIGDQGCQLVAASLLSMKFLSRLNLSYNQIGSRGVNSLMRSLIACDSVTYLGLSGNILRVSGAMALAFTLAQHPRLEELDLDNCCLGQAAQCHITAGIISNRWVPMKRLRGYSVGPPMVAIGALTPHAQNFNNEECFCIRKDEQMKTILQWMESNRMAKRTGRLDPAVVEAISGNNSNNPKFLTPDFVASINDVHGIPSQNAYFRLLGWLSYIPFDDDELNALQKYFYDADGGEGDRGSDGYINLKLRGDLLAALDSEVADEIRFEFPSLASNPRGSVGFDLEKHSDAPNWNDWEVFQGRHLFGMTEEDQVPCDDMDADDAMADSTSVHGRFSQRGSDDEGDGMKHSESAVSNSGRDKKAKVKPRITMFPQFEQQLEELKATATDMIEMEDDPEQQEVILTQYAEASLTILRQLRYHCMNSGLDGWRQAGLKRKVLIIDDSNVTRKLVSRAFEKANFIVDTACNGAEGVEKLKASIYDIAFMDIDMPVMNGFEATKKLREWEDKMRPGARQPICALTAAYVDDFERSELMKFKEAGLDVMESKPCNIPRLFKVVDDVSPMFSDLSISMTKNDRSDSRQSESSENM